MKYSDEALISHIDEENFKISHLITSEEKTILQQLIAEISAEFDVATTLSDPDGTPIFPYCNFTELCEKHIRGCEEGLRRCKKQANIQGHMAEEQGRALVYQCHAGITDFTAPIMLLNRRIGNVSGGQIWARTPDDETCERLNSYFDEIGVKDKAQALVSIRSQKVSNPNRIEKLASIYFNIGKLLSNYFHFQAEYGYWKKSLLALNAELEQRIRQRTLLLEETVNDLNFAQQLLRSQNDELRHNAEIQTVQTQVLNQLQEAVIITNCDSQIIYLNRTAESLFGYSADEAEGKNSAFLIAGGTAIQEDQNRQIITTTTAGGRSTTEITARHKDGHTFPAQLFSVLLKDMSGDFSGIAMFSIDLSRLRKAEETISKIKLDHERQILLTKLIESNEPENPDLMGKVAEVGLNWNRPFKMFVLEIETISTPMARGNSVVSQLLGWVAALGQEVIAWEYMNAVAVMRFDDTADSLTSNAQEKLFKKWETALHKVDPRARLAMGVGHRGTSLADMQRVYTQARQAAWFSRVVDGCGAPCHFKDMGIFQLLTPNWDSNFEMFGQQVLGKLIEMKPSKCGEYMATLEALLSEGTQKAAAEKLFVHEKTVKFRKQRIEEALGYSIDSAAQRMALSLAVRWWKNKV